MPITPKIDPVDLYYLWETTFKSLIDRNTAAVQEAFNENPEQILVSVQLEEDQIDHLSKGLMGRSRRLIPLTLLAKFIKELNS